MIVRARELLLSALDRRPSAILHVLTRRRPDFASRLLAQFKDGVMIRPFFPVQLDEYEFITRKSDITDTLVASVLITSEPVIAGDDIAYWSRFSIFDPTYLIAICLQDIFWWTRHFQVIDYPDCALIDRLGYTNASHSSVSALIEHPHRTQPVFVVPRFGLETARTRTQRHGLARHLNAFGILADVGADWAAAHFPVELKRGDVCALAVPPGPTWRSPSVLRHSPVFHSEYDRQIEDLSAFLEGHGNMIAPWTTEETYRPPGVGRAAEWQISLRPVGGRSGLEPAPLDDALVQQVKVWFDEPGWDIHAPAPPAPLPEAKPDDSQETAESQNGSADPEEVSAEPAKILKGWPGGYPATLADLPAWADATLTGLVLAPRAVRNARKIQHPNPNRIARALELLAGPKLQAYRGRRSSHQAFDRGLLGLRLRDGFSNAENLVGQTGEDYLLRVDGRKLLLDRHLASVSSGFNDPKMIRIYYTYDRLADRIVVGWLPTHLPNSQS